MRFAFTNFFFRLLIKMLILAKKFEKKIYDQLFYNYRILRQFYYLGVSVSLSLLRKTTEQDIFFSKSIDN